MEKHSSFTASRRISISNLYVLTGPESCGKTTLAQALGEALHVPVVPETSRDYLHQKMAADARYHYSEADLLAIAHRQNDTEALLLAESRDVLVCDTDLLVIIVWSEVRFGQCHPGITEMFMKACEANPRQYLLCDYHIPWQPDPLRENPDDRAELFDLYQQKLDYFALDYTIVRGNEEERLVQALALVNL